ARRPHRRRGAPQDRHRRPHRRLRGDVRPPLPRRPRGRRVPHRAGLPLRHRGDRRGARLPHRTPLPDRLDPPRTLDVVLMIGLLAFFTDESIAVVDFARIAEAAGVESLWVPEHTHIPVEPEAPPLGGDLPRYYSRLFDPFLALTAAATVTSRLRLGTGVALAAHHHPITLAKQIATLDRISGGRFLFGVGAGWNRGEIANHGVDHDTRWRRALEHVAAMRAIWTQDEASFAGRWVNFERIWCWPKPVQQPHPPVLLG